VLNRGRRFAAPRRPRARRACPAFDRKTRYTCLQPLHTGTIAWWLRKNGGAEVKPADSVATRQKARPEASAAVAVLTLRLAWAAPRMSCYALHLDGHHRGRALFENTEPCAFYRSPTVSRQPRDGAVLPRPPRRTRFANGPTVVAGRKRGFTTPTDGGEGRALSLYYRPISTLPNPLRRRRRRAARFARAARRPPRSPARGVLRSRATAAFGRVPPARAVTTDQYRATRGHVTLPRRWPSRRVGTR